MATQAVGPFAAFAASTQNSGAPSNAQASAGIGGSVPSEQMFLQLLVAQIKNQNPLNPTEGTQFVAQLAQFAELEQVIAIRQDLDGVAPANNTAPAQQTGI